MKKILFSLCAFLCLFSALAFAADEAPSITFELRTYHANPGKLDALHSRFRDHTMMLFEKHGMMNIGYWVPQDNADNLLIYLLAYEDRKARDASWKAFMADPDWKKAYAESTKDGKLVGKVESLFLNPTDYSPTFRIEKENPQRLFELRKYTTNEGKRKLLDARFRDHTVSLFTKHGMTNLPYFHPDPDQPGAKNLLVYFLAHKDEASRTKGFDGFRDDPAWKKARTESEVDGPLLIKGGVSSTFLIPTDYSPMQ